VFVYTASTPFTPSMLRDITAQAIHFNTSSVLCNNNTHTKTQKRVKFDAEGIPQVQKSLLMQSYGGGKEAESTDQITASDTE
jgi:hypothetical protein